MSFSPRTLGDTRAWHNLFTTDSGIFSVDGVPANQLLMHYIDTSNSHASTGTGTWSVISGNSAYYTPAITDVISTTAGTYSFYPTVNGIPMDSQIIEITDPTKTP